MGRVKELLMKMEERGFDEITSAPDAYAGQCRMSPAGVSMFYGAFDKNIYERKCHCIRPVFRKW